MLYRSSDVNSNRLSMSILDIHAVTMPLFGCDANNRMSMSLSDIHTVAVPSSGCDNNRLSLDIHNVTTPLSGCVFLYSACTGPDQVDLLPVTDCHWKGFVHCYLYVLFRLRLAFSMNYPSFPLFCLLYPCFEPRTLSHCRLLTMSMLRGFMRRHDFKAYLLSWYPLSLRMCRRIVGCFPLSPCSLLALQSAGYRLPVSLSLGISLIVSRMACHIGAFSPHVSECRSTCNFSLQLPYTVHDSGNDCLKLYKCNNEGMYAGGGRAHVFLYNDIMPHAKQALDTYKPSSHFPFVDHVHRTSVSSFYVDDGYVIADVPFQDLIPHISIAAAVKIARNHKISVGSHVPKNQLSGYFANHNCPDCKEYVSVFVSKGMKSTKHGKSGPVSVNVEPTLDVQNRDIHPAEFPPPPLTPTLTNTVISKFCNDCTPEMFQEQGCAVCGQLTPISQLSRLKGLKGMLGILEAKGVTRVERRVSDDPIRELRGPVLDYRCDKICLRCRSSIRKGNVPECALANGLWIGEVPVVLSDLRFIEKLLVAHLRHNCCFVRVASGLRKMTSHGFSSSYP